MRKLGMWSGPVMATMVLVAVGAGLAAGPALAQERGVPWLGVMTQSLDDGLREGLDYRGEGVLVSQVVDNGPADRAGIRKGDILLSVNSRRVESPQELTEVIHQARVGQNASIVVVRDRGRRTVNVRLGERPEDVDTPEADEPRDSPRKLESDLGPMTQWHDGQSDDPNNFVFRGMGRGRLGVRVEDLNDDLGSYFDVPEGRGALVVEVLKDTPAERAGLKAGDVITEVGDRKISDSDDLVKALRESPKGRLSVTAVRKGHPKSFDAELEDAPRAMRFGPGQHDMTLMRPHGDRRIVVPNVRRDVRRGVREDSGDSDDELRQLREEVRQLREKLDQLEEDRD